MQPLCADKLVAGDTWSWSVLLRDYSPDEYALNFYLRGPGGKVDATATADEARFLITVAASDTAKLSAGTYTWQIAVTKDNERTEIGRGTVEILANIATLAEGYDGRSWVKRTLDAIRANLEGRASREEQNYQVAGRSLGLTDPRVLLDLEGEFAARYRKEQIESGQLSPNTNQVHACFHRVGHRHGGCIE